MDLYKNYIGGAWKQGNAEIVNVNPSDLADSVGVYAQGSANDVNLAVSAAINAFPAWSHATPEHRADILDAIGAEILARKNELGDLLSREEGKTLPEGIGEVARAGRIFKFFAGEAVRVQGELLDSVRPGVEVAITREALGVIGVISPWNFPIAIPAWKIAPALAYGNCVIFKPAGLVPGCAWAITEIISRSGIADGVFNLVMGSGSTVGEALVKHNGIAGISFTGSVETGQQIAKKAVARMAKIQLEMGGNNPLVVLNDADIKTAVECAVNGAFFSTGQRCTASSRLIVESGIHDRFVDGVQARMGQLVVDDARKTGTHIGPVIDQSQLNQNIGYLKIADDEGGKLICGGEQLSRETQGYYFSPALIADTSNAMRINREEVFGPVATIIRVQDYEEALDMANDTEFGLASGICTMSLKYASHFRRNSAAGMVMVNLPTAGVDYHVPFGGRKRSSYGSREQGRYAVEFYTSVKTSYTAG